MIHQESIRDCIEISKEEFRALAVTDHRSFEWFLSNMERNGQSVMFAATNREELIRVAKQLQQKQAPAGAFGLVNEDGIPEFLIFHTQGKTFLVACWEGRTDKPQGFKN